MHEATGVATGASEVHHLTPIAVDHRLAFRLSNLQALCVSCHRRAESEILRSPPSIRSAPEGEGVQAPDEESAA